MPTATSSLRQTQANLLALADKSMLCQGHLNPRDATVDRREFGWFADNHIPIAPNRYLCSGLLLLNLGLFRALNAEQQCFDFLSRHPDVYFPDQTVLNAVCHGRTKVLPDDWGMLTWHNPNHHADSRRRRPLRRRRSLDGSLRTG